MGGLHHQFVVHAATPGAVDLQGEKSNEGAHRHTPGKTFQAVTGAGDLTERDSRDTAKYDGQIVDEPRKRGNQKLLAGVLHRHKDTAHKNENLPRKDNAAIVGGALNKFRRGALYGQQLQKFLHPDKCGNHKNEQNNSKSIQYVAEEFPATLKVTRHTVARKNRDKYNGEESGTYHMVQNVRNHEGQIQSVFL